MRIMERPDWAPDTVDLDRPSVARSYDHFLGGSPNVAADREAAHELLATMPDIPRMMRYVVGAGLRQFLDVRSGGPTAGNVHGRSSVLGGVGRRI